MPWEPLQETVREEVPDGASVTLVSLKEHEKTWDDDDTRRLTVPLKPLKLVTVTVEEPDPPPRSMTFDGLDVMLKSDTGMELLQMLVLVIINDNITVPVAV